MTVVQVGVTLPLLVLLLFYVKLILLNRFLIWGFLVPMQLCLVCRVRSRSHALYLLCISA